MRHQIADRPLPTGPLTRAAPNRAFVTVHDTAQHLPRHRHERAYAALILRGGYVEAGDHGRARVSAGDVVIHGAYEAHRNHFPAGGALVLNLPLGAHSLDPGAWEVNDVDTIARLAKRDCLIAADELKAQQRRAVSRETDWPDLLALALSQDPGLAIEEWALGMRLAAPSVSRGFQRVYGITPKRFRAEQRALQAIRALPAWKGTLASLAATMGFADQAHFSRAVTAFTGMSPRAWRVKSVQEADRNTR